MPLPSNEEVLSMDKQAKQQVLCFTIGPCLRSEMFKL